MKALTTGLVATLVLVGAARAEPSKLRVDGGVLVGSLEDGVRTFKGVPFAKPPVGDLRWRPPQPTSWTGERDATHYALPCLQPTPADGRPNGGGVAGASSEDCLYLNVWAPKDARNAPVMVFLYGGAGYLGAASVPTYDGTSLAKQGVILVTVNYRLGMLGQFAHPALTKAAAGNEGLANYQLMDAIAGLQWVQRNGKALGADTKNVTLFGQSAGAVLVAGLQSTPPSRGLFQKAIIQSAVPQVGGGRTLAEAEADGVKFANALGLPGAGATSEQLRALPADQVISEKARFGFQGGNYLVLDGKVRTTKTGPGFASGVTVDVPLVVGSTNAEFFAPEGYKTVKLASTTGKAAAWEYVFTFVPPWRKAEQPRGAPHAAELPYVFNSVDRSPKMNGQATDLDRAVARRMSSCWTAFAKAPVTATSLTCADGFVWKAYTPESDSLAVFGETPTMSKAEPLVRALGEAFPVPPGVGDPAS
ncbi:MULTISPECIES: carboxylesterase/lipase family protein [unclassified Phenylobacterium]|uniref:carboxylesterase/lipase family protein n=1 Tax=unclassified Phenylobacterium TaxID=2640670 RepID=UPI00083AE323|nr:MULTISPECIES: carboxylesterase family protein [unclassified Phenylobacterium]